ncbi:MAG: hypothetical protein QM760_20745 [Nibricoccus sp.]
MIGRAVFRQEYVEEAAIFDCLRDRQVQAELSAAVKEGVTFLFCSGSQVMAEFDSSEQMGSVRRIQAMQRLQLALYGFLQRTKEKKPGPRSRPR